MERIRRSRIYIYIYIGCRHFIFLQTSSKNGREERAITSTRRSIIDRAFERPPVESRSPNAQLNAEGTASGVGVGGSGNNYATFERSV